MARVGLTSCFYRLSLIRAAQSGALNTKHLKSEAEMFAEEGLVADVDLQSLILS